MHNLRIAIDPKLTAHSAPEIHWTWRLLLSAIGWTWREVALGDSCDIAYVIDPEYVTNAKFCIRANPAVWSQPNRYRLDNLANFNGQYSPDHDADPIFDVFWMATGQEERHLTQDKHGFFDLGDAPLLREQVIFKALASQIELWLERKLRELGQPPPVPRWPHGKRAAACVGHDVDYPEVKRWLEPTRIIMRQGRHGIASALDVFMGRRDHWKFAAWVELEKSLQTRSAFYFVPRKGSLLEYASGTPDPFYDVTSKRFRELFRYLADEGFEIGLHASYLAYQSHEKFAAEKRRLEEASGIAVVGNRHHYWHMNPHDVEDTLFIHEQAGFKYDSSLIHDHYLGWRRGLSHPFFPFYQAERRELKTLQIATSWMDDQVFGALSHNMNDHTTVERMTLLRSLVERSAEQGGCFNVDIHDYVFDDVLFPRWMQTFQQVWQYILDRGDFWIGTPAEVAQHWNERYADLVRNSQGLDEGRA